MPDLSHKAVHQYWHDYPDMMIYRVIAFMEGVEHWIVDEDAAIEKIIEELGKELDDIGKIDLAKLGHEDLFLTIGNYLSTGRVLRLLQAIDTVHPGSASKLLIFAEETSRSPDDTPGLFLRRNVVFERLRLLGRVFSAERVALVTKALEGEEHV
ncbi:MAG: type IVB secretion system protein IcmW [Gammaproteobacteria bacterium]